MQWRSGTAAACSCKQQPSNDNGPGASRALQPCLPTRSHGPRAATSSSVRQATTAREIDLDCLQFTVSTLAKLWRALGEELPLRHAGTHLASCQACQETARSGDWRAAPLGEQIWGIRRPCNPSVGHDEAPRCSPRRNMLVLLSRNMCHWRSRALRGK